MGVTWIQGAIHARDSDVGHEYQSYVIHHQQMFIVLIPTMQV
jgi:hypothetical protein